MAQAIYGTGPQSFPASTRFLREMAEGGQILFEKDPASTLNGVDVVLDTIGDRVRFFEGAAPNRGAFIDLLQGGGASARLTTTLDFPSSLSGNGWQKLSSGLIIQWGLSGASTTNMNITFPLAFPNYCNAVWTTGEAAALVYPISTALFQIAGKTKTGFTAVNLGGVYQASAGATPSFTTSPMSGCPWLAIGF